MTTALTVRQADGTRKELGGQAVPGSAGALGALATVAADIAFPATNGNITAAQPVISTPVAGGTVEVDVSQAGGVAVFLKQAPAAVTLLFEASLESSGDTNWFGVQMARTNANSVEATSGSLAAVPAYAWEGSVAGFARFRVRASTYTSGTVIVSICPAATGVEPAPAIPQITTVSAVSASTPAAASASAGTSAATTNAAIVKAAGGDVMSVTATNYGAAAAYLKLYNKATAPTVGTDKPALTIPIPANSYVVLEFGAQGSRFATGIGMAITNLMPIADATAVAADQVAWNITFK